MSQPHKYPTNKKKEEPKKVEPRLRPFYTQGSFYATGGSTGVTMPFGSMTYSTSTITVV